MSDMVGSADAVELVLSAQRRYAETKYRQSTIGLTIPEAFVRGIRHIGYRNNVNAIAELIDNSIQAYSLRVDVVFVYDESVSVKKPSGLAVIDDGHGMDPEMLRLAMMWGGTHRENDRCGLGRYGYGLPCSAISIGRRFTVISKVLGGQPFAVTLDLDQLDSRKYRNPAGHLTLPSARPVTLPRFVREHLRRVYPAGWRSGTIVLIEKLDRLDWATTLGIRTNLIRHFGVTYHKLANATAIYVDGHPVLPIDPLFLTNECEFFALDEDRAQPLDRIEVKVRNTTAGDQEGQIYLRYAWLPPSFGAVDKARDAVGINANARFPILKDYHGLIFSRNGRIIDVQTRTPWTVFINNDRYIRVEVEFSASLDEMFGVTTSKQQVSASTEVWDALREAGLPKAIEQLRGKVRSAKLERRTIEIGRASDAGPRATKSKAIAISHRRGPVGSARADDGVSVAELIPLFRLDAASRSLLPNEIHPLLNGQSTALETARALRILLAHLGHGFGSRTDHSRAEVAAILARWGAELNLAVIPNDEMAPCP